MVRGKNCRVIVVQPPNRQIFEEAIFLVNENKVKDECVSESAIIREAQSIAENYIKAHRIHKKTVKKPPLFYCALGAIVTGLIWIASNLFMR